MRNSAWPGRMTPTSQNLPLCRRHPTAPLKSRATRPPEPSSGRPCMPSAGCAARRNELECPLYLAEQANWQRQRKHSRPQPRSSVPPLPVCRLTPVPATGNRSTTARRRARTQENQGAEPGSMPPERVGCRRIGCRWRDAGRTCRHQERAVMEARVSWAQDPLPLPAGCPAAWVQNLVTVEVNSGGARAAVAESMMAGDVGEVIHSLADEPDVTVTTSGSHPAGGKVMIAVLADPDGRSVVLARMNRPGASPELRRPAERVGHLSLGARAREPPVVGSRRRGTSRSAHTVCGRRTYRGAHRRRYGRCAWQTVVVTPTPVTG